MKVTALIPDKLIEEVKTLSNGKNITESLIKALKEWVALQKIKTLNKSIEHKPFEFKANFESNSLRDINRN